MPWTRDKIDAELAKLEARAPQLIEQHQDEADFWPAFAGIADCITENAGADDREHVQSRITSILSSIGMIPSDDEGQSCTPEEWHAYEITAEQFTKLQPALDDLSLRHEIWAIRSEANVSVVFRSPAPSLPGALQKSVDARSPENDPNAVRL